MVRGGNEDLMHIAQVIALNMVRNTTEKTALQKKVKRLYNISQVLTSF